MVASLTGSPMPSSKPISTNCTTIWACDSLAATTLAGVQTARTINRRMPYETIVQPHGARGRVRVRLRGGAIQRRKHQYRRHERHVGYLFRSQRPGLRGCGEDG